MIPEKLPSITSYAVLKERIAYLEAVKDQQEEMLKKNVFEVYRSLQPAELLKSAALKIREDKEMEEAATIAGDAGIDLFVKKIFRKDDSLGGMIKSLIASEVIRAVYHKYHGRIHELVGNMAEKLVNLLDMGSSRKQGES